MELRDQSTRAERLAKELEQHEGYRVLRAVPPPPSGEPKGTPPDAMCVAIVDCETTGLDVGHDEIIELAMLLAWVDENGEVISHGKLRSWLQQPSTKLDETIVRLTGLTDDDLEGQSIDDERVARSLSKVDLVIAHNASFDRAWLERRYPFLADKDWACSCREIDWPALGFEGRSQGHLLLQHGWFSNAHRAGDDVWSLLHLLRQETPEPGGDRTRSHMSRLVEKSARETLLVEAVGSPYSKKDLLKARGYRYDPRKRLWWTEIDPTEFLVEQTWFACNDLPQFHSRELTARDRHR